jgi:hypothetical protein
VPTVSAEWPPLVSIDVASVSVTDPYGLGFLDRSDLPDNNLNIFPWARGSVVVKVLCYKCASFEVQTGL